MSKVTYTSPSQTYAFSANGYSAQNDSWGVESLNLTDGVDYSASVTFDPTTVTGTIFSWTYPNINNWVSAYPHINFDPSAANVSTTQTGNMASLTANYSASLSDPTNASLAFDLWFNSQSNGAWSTTSDELLIQVHATSSYSNEPFTLSGSGFTKAIVNVSNQSSSGANWKFIVVTLPSDMMSGSLSISDVIKGLIQDGVMTGQEYLTSLQFGSEVISGTGSLQINSLSYGWAANATVTLAAGNNTLTISNPGGNDVVGNGNVDTVVYAGSYSSHQIEQVSSEMLVTTNGSISTLDELQGITYIQFADGVYNVVTATFTPGVKPPNVTEKLASDTGASSTDNITSNDALTGTGAPNAVVQFTVDGTAINTTVSANASGVWTFTPTGLSNGTHTIVASETNSAGTGSASLTFTLDTTPPVVSITNEVFSGGKVTLTGAASQAGDTISVYDGTTLLGTTTSGSGGVWSFSTGTVSSTLHKYTVMAVDIAGNVGNSSNYAIAASTAKATLDGTGSDILIGTGKDNIFIGSGGGNVLTGGGANDTFVFNSNTDSTPANYDTITNFNHVNDTIQFSGISGINASHGVPTFQGQLSGTGNLYLNAHSIAYIEAGGNTYVLVNTTGAIETVSALNLHAANMQIVLTGTHLGLTSSDFHLA